MHEPADPLPRWDPLVEQMLRAMSANPTPAGVGGRKPLLRLGVLRLKLQVGARPGQSGLLAVTTIATFAAIGMLAASWPWLDPKASLGDVVAAMATATAFSSLVFSAFVLPQAAAAKVAPGYTSEIAQRPALWLVAIAQVLATAFLFSVASMGPSKAFAAGAGFLTASLFGWTWLAAFRVAASGDPLEVAQRQAVYLRRSCARAIDHTRSMTLAWVTRKRREDFLETPWLLTQDGPILNGFLRHLRSGVTASIAQDTPATLPTYWTAQIACYMDYAARTNGRVGASWGALDTLLETAVQMVDAAQAAGGETDRTVAQALTQFEVLAGQPYADIEYAAVRGKIIDFTRRALEMTWHNDQSVLPANQTISHGHLVAIFMSIGAFEDVVSVLDQLDAISQRARSDQRSHIEIAALQAMADSLPAIAVDGRPSDAIRVGLLGKWCSVASAAMVVQATRPITMIRPADVIVPGISINGRGIQNQAWPRALSEGASYPFADALANVAASTAQARNANPGPNPWLRVDEPIATLYWASIFLTGHELSMDSRRAAAARLLAALRSCLPHDAEAEALARGDVAEMYWSATVACAYLADDVELINLELEWVRETAHKVTEVHSSVALHLFAAARLLGGQPREEVDRWVDSAPGDWIGAGFNVEPIGIAPGLNRNRVAVPPRTITVIEGWLLQRLPELR